MLKKTQYSFEILHADGMMLETVEKLQSPPRMNACQMTNRIIRSNTADERQYNNEIFSKAYTGYNCTQIKNY